MKAMKYMARTAAELEHWLNGIRPRLLSWEDNTQQTCNRVTLRSKYPVSLRLPSGAELVGLAEAAGTLGPHFMEDPDPELVQTLRALVRLLEQATVQTRYSASHEKPGYVLGYSLNQGGASVKFQSGFGELEVENNRHAYTQLFRALGVKVKFVRRGPTFDLIPEEGVPLVPLVKGLNGGPEMILCGLKEEYSGQGLEKIAQHIRDQHWQVSSTALGIAFLPPQPGVANTGEETLEKLNRAGLPLKTVDLGLWCTIASWKQLAALQALRELSRDRSSLDLDILRVAIKPKLQGLVNVTPKKTGLEAGIYASEGVDAEEFHGELARVLASGR